ncbi:hypothetical protein M153_9600001945 [Pseudoloma neurophilia]|uniref:Uncharacterized protein n=1 Tax=Pseudoloma neurophilia TaxID=146866 RepID=A0A0R0M1V6_9MICR|nr:hypothetical protein M153_9600001945 [Pseudoloma neurophilia]
MHLEDETEFFEFDPYSFLGKIPDILEESIKTTLDGVNVPEKVKRELINHFSIELRKNHVLFEDFCIPQIFTFPNDYVYERKLTESVSDFNIEKKLENLAKLKDDLQYHKSELKSTNMSIQKEIKLKSEMDKFLENPDVNDLLSNTEFLKSLFLETQKAFGEHSFETATDRSEEFNKIMQSKDIKTETKVKELGQLLAIGQLDDIDAFKTNFFELKSNL